MTGALDRAAWGEAADELFGDLAAWRGTHPRATLAEIEVAIEERLARLRTRLLTDTVHASARIELEGTASVCPGCGGRLQRRGRARRTVQTAEGAELTLERTYGSCPRCGARVFPPGPGTGATSA